MNGNLVQQLRTLGRPVARISLLGLCLGCASAPVSQGPSDGEDRSAPALEPGDAVAVRIWRQPDLSGEFRVDERGVVTLPLLGERVVAGVPTDSLRDTLTAAYREYLRNPSLVVTFLRRVNILGEVRLPGLYSADATMTLADALALAGGVAPSGDSRDVRLVRGGEVVRRNLEATAVLAASPIRSGDQIVVGQRSWFSRNTAIVASLIGAASSIGVALILR